MQLYAPQLENPLKNLLWTIIPICLLFTANWSYEFYTSILDSAHIQQQIDSIRVPKPTSPPPPQSTLHTTPYIVPEPVAPQRDSSVEIAALSMKLKMTNEVSWTAILKIATLWSFLLFSSLIYFIVYRRYAR